MRNSNNISGNNTFQTFNMYSDLIVSTFAKFELKFNLNRNFDIGCVRIIVRRFDWSLVLNALFCPRGISSTLWECIGTF